MISYNKIMEVIDLCDVDNICVEVDKLQDLNDDQINGIWDGFYGKEVISTPLNEDEINYLIAPDNNSYIVPGVYTDTLLNEGFTRNYFSDQKPYIYNLRFNHLDKLLVVYVVICPYRNQCMFINSNAYQVFKDMCYKDISATINKALRENKKELNRIKKGSK